MPAEQGSLRLTGKAAALAIGRTMSAGQGSFTLSGSAASFPVALSISATFGQFNLTGIGAILTYTPGHGGGATIPHSNPFIATPGPMTSLP
jgi:hypothetical protein